MFNDAEGLAEALKQCIRVGVVTSTDPGAATVRCKCVDADGLITYPLRVLNHKTLDDKAYWMPDVGEHVLCLFLPYGNEQGFVLGAFYSEADTPPVSDQDKRHVAYEDGTWWEYDRKNHVFTAHVAGDIFIEATGHVTIIGERIDLNPEG